MKELKLKYLIIENFIPPEEKERVLSRAQFDEEEDCWKLLPARLFRSASLPTIMTF